MIFYILNHHIKTENKSKLSAERGEKKLYNFLRLKLVFSTEQRNACTLCSLLLRNKEQWYKALVLFHSIYNRLFSPAEELAHNVV